VSHGEAQVYRILSDKEDKSGMEQGEIGSGKKGSEALETSASVECTLHGFLTVFANLDWDAFRASFDDEATVFFPRGDQPTRAEGRDEIERVFLREFEEARAGASGPPYLDLRPNDLLIQEMGDIAVVSFHLILLGALRRRTFVLRRRDGAWKILHLHASNISDAMAE
jgi:ketosteroid isomerase-like protein